MEAGQNDLAQLKQRMRAAWMAGDFGQVARHSAIAAEEFVSGLGIKATDRVLDVACGTGNLAIPAARLAAKVTGVDIATNLLEQARERAETEGVKAEFDEGDAEQLPYADGQFDVVMTMFGAMFAPRPERAAAELIRVCRPGGTIAMANWIREGFVGKTFELSAQFAPPPEGIPAPPLWGDEQVVRERLANGTSSIHTTRRKMALEYSFSPTEVVQFFRTYFGPTKMTFSRLDEQGQKEYAAGLEKLWIEHNNAKGDGTSVWAEYLEVIATRSI